MRTPLSVVIPTLDEAEMVGACLDSVAFADEIVVVDSGSTDVTAEIARGRGAAVLTHAFEGHAEQKNWGIAQVAHDWVLILDADERVTDELRREIEALLEGTPERRGYWIRRRNTFLGREIRGCGWQRDKVLRLFDRRAGRYAARRVHEEVRLDAEPGRLRHALLHHSCRDLTTWLGKVDRYAALGAAELAARGRRPRWSDLVFRPPARFVKQWLLQGGFRDGAEGAVLCAFSAYGVFAKYARLRDHAEGRS
ncbi:glycosyltransferase family 2 protein [bacterium]|nr:glycosyltransferase family 2 protein [bacterium]